MKTTYCSKTHRYTAEHRLPSGRLLIADDTTLALAMASLFLLIAMAKDA